MIAYLILSHRDPDQVLRLARRLVASDPQAVVVIHHDVTVPALAATDNPRILIIDARLRVSWGEFSMVAALLHGLRWIVDRGIPCDWVVLLSGQDYPVMPPASLEAELNASGFDGFIEHHTAEERFAEENETRYFRAWRRIPDAIRPFAERAWRLNAVQPWFRIGMTRAGCFIGWRSRVPFTRAFRCYRGSFWWTLSRPCIDYLLTFSAHRPDVVHAFERKLHPDESFVQTVLANADRFKLANDDQRYIVWPAGHDGSPAVLREDDYAAIVASKKRFARKFDAGRDPAILDRLDAYIETGQS